MEKELKEAVGALRACTDWMESLRESGDAGFWEWDSEDDAYNRAMKVLEKHPESKGNWTDWEYWWIFELDPNQQRNMKSRYFPQKLDWEFEKSDIEYMYEREH
jgi:hypothetical protein